MVTLENADVTLKQY
jgi:hypothetical protein